MAEIQYITGGRLGDFIHVMYVIYLNYLHTGKKGTIYLTDKKEHGSKPFFFNLMQTHKELKPLVLAQEYIGGFELLQDKKLDENAVNLNLFRQHRYQNNWLQLLAKIHQLPFKSAPWIKIKSTNQLLQDKILIHQSARRHTPNFPWVDILTKNKCVFITCDQKEYKRFPHHNLVDLHLCQNVSEMMEALNGCKFFIGNQSAPLAMAVSLNKPCLAGLHYPDAPHYMKMQDFYQNFFWISKQDKCIQGLEQFIIFDDQSIPSTGRFRDRPFKDRPRARNKFVEPIKHHRFYGQFQTDQHIRKFFPDQTSGTCIEIGATNGIKSSNTYHFEQNGWKCLCIEPNPEYYQQLKVNRKQTLNVACGAQNLEAQPFTIFTLPRNNQSAISSLKVDERLVESHKHLIMSQKTIQVPVRTLDSILQQYPSITKIDFISIDTEGTELEVLRGFNLNKWKPKLLVIENNFDQPEIENYLKDFNYKKVLRIRVNDFYLINDAN